MRYGTLIRENIKKHKGGYIGIFLLVFIITISLSAVLSIWTNSKAYVVSEMERLEFGDILYWMNNNSERIDNIKAELEKMDGVERVKVVDNIAAEVAISGYEGTRSVFAYKYVDGTYNVFDGDSISKLETVEPLEKGEMYAPIAYKSLYDAQLGDMIAIDGYGDLKIKGFFEDPTVGGTMVGIKNILISDEDFVTLENTESEKYKAECDLHLFKDKKSGISTLELQKVISENIDLKEDTIFAYTSTNFVGFMLALQNIFIGILLGFVLVLLIVALIVISHSISTGIDQSYSDLGILKALGYTKADLCKVQVYQYMLVILTALATGLLTSAFLVKLINQIILPSTGILAPSTMPVGLSFACFGSIVLLLAVFIILKVSRIGKITPMTAIRGGRSDVYFDSRIHTQIHGKGLQFWLALRQLTTGKKRYIGACVVTALLVFFWAFCTRMFAWVGEDGSGVVNSMGVAKIDDKAYDFAIWYTDSETQTAVERLIEDTTPIVNRYESGSSNLQLNGVGFMVNIISKPEYIIMVDGRYCQYDNEIVITEMVAEEMNLKIGDTVRVGYDRQSLDFIISGINQCTNDMGSNFTMSFAGYERIFGKVKDRFHNYFLEDGSQKKYLVDTIVEKYGNKLSLDDNSWSGAGAVVTGANALSVLMYVISTIFILIVVALTGGRILYKEKQDLAIYRAIGVSPFGLRLSFALRFLIVSVIGSVFGIILSLTMTDFLATRMFKFVGVSNFHSPINVPGMIQAVVFVVALFFGFAFVIGKRGRVLRLDFEE